MDRQWNTAFSNSNLLVKIRFIFRPNNATMPCVDPQSVAPNGPIHDPGLYPVMIASCKSPTASLSVVYELARANPDLVIPH